MHKTLQSLLQQRPVITDGAWATQLQPHGWKLGESPEHWNLIHPEIIDSIARSYVAAGSQLILTNTFGGNRARLEAYGLADQLAPINRAGVHRSKQAARKKAHVFASLGPTGLKTASEAHFTDLFQEQAAILAEAGAEGLVLETMTNLQEACCAVRAAKSTHLPVVASMVFNSQKESLQSFAGESLAAVVHALIQAGADVIGTNCQSDLPHLLQLTRALKKTAPRPIWIKPNAGLPPHILSPKNFAQSAHALTQAGADFIGGCCGTTPAHILALKTPFPHP